MLYLIESLTFGFCVFLSSLPWIWSFVESFHASLVLSTLLALTLILVNVIRHIMDSEKVIICYVHDLISIEAIISF